MLTPVHSISPEFEIVRSAHRMAELRIRHLLVAKSDGSLIGILSDRDVLRFLVRQFGGVQRGTDPQRTVEHLMTRHPITLPPDASVSTAAGLMATRKIGCIPIVVQHQQVVGIVSRGDVLRFAQQLLTTLAEASAADDVGQS